MLKMNKLIIRPILLFQILILTLSIPGLAYQPGSESDEIRQMLETRDNEIKDILGPKGEEYTTEQREKLKNVINGVIDFREMAEFALGDTFQDLEETEREEFVSLFSTIIRDNSLNRLDIYRAEITYEEIEVNEDTANVRTIAQLENVRTPVYYDMRKKGDNWVITDMIIDDVSTADSYNRQFQSIIRKRGYDALKQSLEKRAARAENAS